MGFDESHHCDLQEITYALLIAPVSTQRQRWDDRTNCD
ncbi:hypothetical protein I551_3986 [Mycobacterium ulcerans str. Harvey]|uniref:Uncharacterized protein n=1 Tax=Mycobacterium ulcerans str. Harvey TaxID=1299332 RepID=A0ABP3AEZ2_MYCUL|nr:hypothetical protein I551_3986 [Mycobacterium ulcerans str. Harvey]